MMVKYRTGGYGKPNIEQVEVAGETECFVILPPKPGYRDRREKKRSDYTNYYDSWAEAHAALMGRAANKLNAARLALQSAQGEYGNVMGMKPPCA